METYPKSMLPDIKDKSEIRYEPRINRTEYDSGRIRQRLLDDQRTLYYRVQWLKSDYQKTIFESFYRHKLKHGNDWFLLDIPVSQGFREAEVRFISGTYSYDYVQDGMWYISANIEVTSEYELSEEALDTILNLTLSNPSLPMVDGIGEIINQDIPEILN